jgi:response regulator of citrate/malate metabolism
MLLFFTKRFKKRVEISKSIIEEINKKDISKWKYIYNGFDIYINKSKGIRYIKQNKKFYNKENDIFIKVKKRFGFTSDVMKNIDYIIKAIEKRIRKEEKEYVKNSKNNTEKKIKRKILEVKKELKIKNSTLHELSRMPDGGDVLYKKTYNRVNELEEKLKELKKLL